MGATRIDWDGAGDRYYETGVDHCVLYTKPEGSKEYKNGVAWNGITAINESPSGAEPSPLYADNIKYLNLMSVEEFAASIEAYYYPDEFEKCDGTADLATGVTIGQQKRELFGLAFRSRIGNDLDGDEAGYKLHIIYNCLAAPSEKAHSTVNDSPEAGTFSWEVSTTPVNVSGLKATANVTIDSTKANENKLKELEDILYGVDAPDFSEESTYAVGDYVTHTTNIYKCTTAVSVAGEWNESNWTEVENPGPRLPFPDEIAEIFAEG